MLNFEPHKTTYKISIEVGRSVVNSENTTHNYSPHAKLRRSAIILLITCTTMEVPMLAVTMEVPMLASIAITILGRISPRASVHYLYFIGISSLRLSGRTSPL